MQNDLISRNALLEEIKSLSVTVTGLRAGKGILSEYAKQYKKSLLKIINEQPTAYDVDAVVGALENMKLVRVEQCHEDYEIEVMTESNFNDAIDIIRKGGKE